MCDAPMKALARQPTHPCTLKLCPSCCNCARQICRLTFPRAAVDECFSNRHVEPGRHGNLLSLKSALTFQFDVNKRWEISRSRLSVRVPPDRAATKRATW